MTPQEQKEEFERCKNDPLYLYNNYWTVDGHKPRPVSQEEWDFNIAIFNGRASYGRYGRVVFPNRRDGDSMVAAGYAMFASKPRDYIKEMREEGVGYLEAIFNKYDSIMEAKERHRNTMNIRKTTGDLLYYVGDTLSHYRRMQNHFLAVNCLTQNEDLEKYKLREHMVFTSPLPSHNPFPVLDPDDFLEDTKWNTLMLLQQHGMYKEFYEMLNAIDGTPIPNEYLPWKVRIKNFIRRF